MPRFAWVFLAIFTQLLLSGCSKSDASIYNLPISQTYEMLCRLDLGEDVGSGVFRYYDQTYPLASKPNQSVAWRMTNGMEVVVRLKEAGDDKTRVDYDIYVPPEREGNVPPPMRGLLKLMVRERIDSYLEDRPFNDKPIVSAMYNNTPAGMMVGPGMEDRVAAALKMDAEMRRQSQDGY
jgi:hypothetical protein